MIRVCLFGNKAYGFDITGWEDKKSEIYGYDNLLDEDLLERIDQGDILMYCDSSDSAEDWCDDHDITFEMIEVSEDDNN